MYGCFLEHYNLNLIKSRVFYFFNYTLYHHILSPTLLFKSYFIHLDHINSNLFPQLALELWYKKIYFLLLLFVFSHFCFLFWKLSGMVIKMQHGSKINKPMARFKHLPFSSQSLLILKVTSLIGSWRPIGYKSLNLTVKFGIVYQTQTNTTWTLEISPSVTN